MLQDDGPKGTDPAAQEYKKLRGVGDRRRGANTLD
jgi:hypothetical protein